MELFPISIVALLLQMETKMEICPQHMLWFRRWHIKTFQRALAGRDFTNGLQWRTMIPSTVQRCAPTCSREWKLCLFFSLYITFPLFFHEYYYQRIVHTWESESETEQKTTKINLSSSDAKVKWGEKPGINFLIY